MVSLDRLNGGRQSCFLFPLSVCWICFCGWRAFDGARQVRQRETEERVQLEMRENKCIPDYHITTSREQRCIKVFFGFDLTLGVWKPRIGFWLVTRT